MPPVISVENLSKVYRLGQIGTGTFSYDLALWWARLRGRPNPFLRIGETDHGNRMGEELWALKDVSFTVEQGEVLGIIGRNGAGKSTLLKILSRVTAPTSGKVKIKGRVASLLEVGTGFHPELTGRENIYLNGAILGMTRAEIARKFDEIVDFAEVEKFIDTPVKRYSSGMYVRLAFAVAAHLEPEILVVDEVLAVGDAAFQKKCLGKMGEVAKEGRTVLFVSHNMSAVQDLCEQAVWVDSGKLRFRGASEDAIASYLGSSSPDHALAGLVKGGELCFNRISIFQNDSSVADIVDGSQPFKIMMQYEVRKPLSNLLLGYDVSSANGGHLFKTYDLNAYGMGLRVEGSYVSEYLFPPNVLGDGVYTFGLLAGIHRVRWLTQGDFGLRITVQSLKTSDVTTSGLLRPLGEWRVFQA